MRENILCSPPLQNSSSVLHSSNVAQGFPLVPSPGGVAFPAGPVDPTAMGWMSVLLDLSIRLH